MRFWQKIFLITLAILLVSLNIFAYVFIENSLSTNLDKEVQNRLNEYRLMRVSFQTNLVYQKYLLEKTSLTKDEIMGIFNDFSSTYVGSTLSFSEADKSQIKSDLDMADVEIHNNDGKFMLNISSVFQVDSEVFKLSSTTDISGIYNTALQQIELSRELILMVSLITAIITIIISLALTYRINALRRSTQKMSHGIFFMRAKVSSSDEIGELAEDFNTMADTVESKVNELSQIAEDRKRFIDNIAHEMKTPLTSIIGFADLLRKAKLDNKTKVDYADTIYREGMHLKNVSSKLMEIILLGKTNPSKKEIDSSDFLDEVFQSMEQICVNSGIVLVLQKYNGKYVFNIDIELMKSLFYNLIDNAIKASKPQSRIILSSGFSEDQGNKEFYISVKDFGRGIPAEEIPKITQPFYMLDKARTREHGGAGLGLALCSEIADLHNASLKIESILGEGTEMKVIFHKEENKQ